MPTYRLYLFDSRGHISRAILLESEDDLGAIAAAEQHRDGRAAELWLLARLVKAFPAEQSTPKDHPLPRPP